MNPQQRRIDDIVGTLGLALPQGWNRNRVETDIKRAAEHVAQSASARSVPTPRGMVKAIGAVLASSEIDEVWRYADLLIDLAPEYIAVCIDISAQSRTAYLLNQD